jgi:uncharacterized protein
MTHTLNSRLLSYFAWVLVLSVPFYVWGVVAPVHGLPFGLPATATMIILPALVATLLTRYELGASAAWQMWKRVGDVSRAKPVWLITAAAIMPAVSVLAFFLMRAIGLPLPTVISIAWPQVPLLVAVYLLGAAFEEIGWTGYATSRMEPQFGVMRTGLLIGIVWAAWHMIPWWLGQGHAASWVIGQSALTVLMRIVMVWIYSQGGQSLFASIVFHAMINTSDSMFPNNGSHYNPTVVLLPMALLVAVIAFCSRPHSRTSI